MSTSLTTIALEPDGSQTRLTYTEQGVHFDGLDSPEGREEGSAACSTSSAPISSAAPEGSIPFHRKAELDDNSDSSDVGFR